MRLDKLYLYDIVVVVDGSVVAWFTALSDLLTPHVD